jgi:alkylhydroperoxidase/carboxymuconolactone decarboxylase family protein YurZ
LIRASEPYAGFRFFKGKAERGGFSMNKPRVKLMEIDEAKGDVKDVFEDMQRVRGKGRVSNLFKGYAIWPELLRANWQRMKVVMRGGNLSRKVKESVMIAVAELNQCDY